MTPGEAHDAGPQVLQGEYAVTSWSPWEVGVGDMATLEKVQRRALGMVSNLRGRNYNARL